MIFCPTLFKGCTKHICDVKTVSETSSDINYTSLQLAVLKIIMSQGGARVITMALFNLITSP